MYVLSSFYLPLNINVTKQNVSKVVNRNYKKVGRFPWLNKKCSLTNILLFKGAESVDNYLIHKFVINLS